ncbi:Flp pilus assembly protein TadG [Caulobacter ginsengisoli]|uniref:Flp pilus assembly protein TadG n=1 Tax=Caulobacter ginsengisoli TaxID=400775 RepID=A0ABU0IWV8_9CAUL|nr:pilus assembly protein [Caulobacter ginsengisoli]MDQ0466489.1 Flp pilus assembly protein TadG [Caulobacter ginsengisoli]
MSPHKGLAPLRRIVNFLGRFAGNRRGAIAVQAALCAGPILVMTFGALDIANASQEKTRLQDALDAAALAAARSPATTDAGLAAVGDPTLAADMTGSKATVTSKSFHLDGSKVMASATAKVPALIAGIWSQGDMTIGVKAEVVRASNDVEVALVLDTTGSMAGTRIDDLKTAAKDLIDIVVKTNQTPFYTKVALVPYSMAVNVGSTYATQVRGSYTAGTCTTPGCASFKFTNPSGNFKTFAISNCVSERTGADAFTDAAPSAAPLGRNYPASGNPCIASTIVPLSSDRDFLKGKVDALSASGSTGGHIGVAWGWYMVSPRFGYLWPSASQPAAYGGEHLLKVVVLMTDGEYNSTYCKGVISQDSTSGSGSSSDHINCDAPNGSAFTQSQTLCTNMKAAGVIVYTVGFDVVNDQRAKDLVNGCATDAQHVYLPSTGVALQDAFRAIGRDIDSLRLSK